MLLEIADRDLTEWNTELSFRTPMQVLAVRRYPACPELSTYPLCPRCNLPMEREYQRYCDHCGQALSWKDFSRATVTLV